MPLVMSKSEWARLVKWTDPNKENPEVVRQRQYVKRLDEISKRMTRDWPNSLENVNKRNEELRRARLEVAEQANARFYRRYVRRQREEQQRLMHSARDVIFKNKDAPKLLLSAVIETTIQKERQEQLKFNEARKREETEQKRKEDAEIIRKAAEWHEHKEAQRRRRFEVNKQHQQDIIEQRNEVEERKRREYETELAYQKMDNMQAKHQMEELAEFEAQFKADEKARIFKDMERSKQEVSARRAEAAARDRLDDRLLVVLRRSRARTDARRTQTERDVKAEKMRVLEAISSKLQSGDAARDAAEQACRDKAWREKEEAAEEKLRQQKQRHEQFVATRREAREHFLAERARLEREAGTRRQWEIMNRFKNAELYEEYQEKLRKEKERKIKEFREDCLRLWRERDAREARERAETRYFYGELAEKKLRHADNQLLTHANALVEEARRLGRPDHAIKAAVDRYCKLYRLYPMPDLPASLREHTAGYAPRDGSAPDAHYREPPPPPPDRGPDEPDAHDAAPATETEPRVNGKRDGLQPINKAAPCRPADRESVEDYKRAGRADGLQRRFAEHDLKLPHIQPPCECCTCSKDK